MTGEAAEWEKMESFAVEQDDCKDKFELDTGENAPESGCCCAGRTKERSGKEKRDLMNRLSRIEGQVRGIRKMVAEDAYCINVLTQVAAANAALNSFTGVLLAEHIKTCVADDIREGKEETVDELVMLLKKLMK